MLQGFEAYSGSVLRVKEVTSTTFSQLPEEG